MFGFNKYIVYGLIAFVSITIFGTFVLMWKNAIEQRTIAEFNRQQVEIVLKQQQAFNEQMQDINKNQLALLEELQTRNKELQDKLDGIQNYLDSDEAKKSDRASSEVLKRVIEQISGKKK